MGTPILFAGGGSESRRPAAHKRRPACGGSPWASLPPAEQLPQPSRASSSAFRSSYPGLPRRAYMLFLYASTPG